MISIVILALFCCFVSNLFFTKNLIHPAVITSLIWFAIVTIFTYFQSDLYPISDSLYFILLIWVVFFSVSSIFFSKVKVPSSNYNLTLNITVYNIVYIFAIVSTLFLILLLINKAGGISVSMIINLRETQLNETNPFINLFYYINSFCLVFFAFSLLYSSKISVKLLLLLGVLLFIAALLKTNKTSIFQFFFIIVFILYKKKKLYIKSIILIILIGGFIIYSFTVFRDSGADSDSFDLGRYLSIYLLSPLPAFDLFVTGDLYSVANNPWGSGTFNFFYNLFAGFGFDFRREGYFQWVYVPYPTNVFTIMSTYYIDFGIQGILCGSFLLGSIWGILFKLQKKNSLFAILFYSVIFYALFFQFFADFLFATLSVTFQYFISALIICFIFNRKTNNGKN